MSKIIKNSYLFIILFLIYILKEPIYSIFKININEYKSVECNIKENKYNKLLEFNNIDYIYKSEYINTTIIYKNIYNYMSEITIRGGKDYNFNSNPVIYDNTLIGVINKVYNNYSKVTLLNNKKTKISVRINDEVGVLLYKDNKLIIDNIININNIYIGDNIYTSGLGNIKEDIYIGTVKNIIKDNKNINSIVEVNTNINIKDIDYVTVIKENI